MPIPKLYRFKDGTVRSEAEAGSAIRSMSEDDLIANGIERDRTLELERWLSAQSMDTKLLFVLDVNWDAHDEIVMRMLGDANLDRSIAAWVFWHIGMREWPHLEKGETGVASLILTNWERGFYKSSALELGRCEILEPVQDYLALLKSGAKVPPIKIPRALTHPFDGRPAVVSPPIDRKTREALQDCFAGNSLFEFLMTERKKNNFLYWAERNGFLPELNSQASPNPGTLATADYLESVFGDNETYASAKNAARQKASRPHPAGLDPKLLQSLSGQSKAGSGSFAWRNRYAIGILLGSAILILSALIAHRLRTGQW